MKFQSTIKMILINFSILSMMVGCATTGEHSDKGFSYTNIPVSHETALTGDGNHIQFRGSELSLTGKALQVGDTLRAVQVTKNDLSLMNVATSNDRIRIINIVPSLDTKVCEQQTHYLSEKNQGLDQNISFITISVDTPFAQDRFAKEAKIDNVLFLSDYRGGEFGKAHGLLLEEPHVLARAVMVVDQHNIIRHLQVTPDLGQLPDMETAFEEAKRLMKASS